MSTPAQNTQLNQPVNADIETGIIMLVCEESGMPARMDSMLIDDLHLDSLSFVHLAVQIEQRFSLPTIQDSDLFKLRTVGQMVAYVEAYIQRRDAVARDRERQSATVGGAQ